ncbi:MAG: hypothetical protein ABEL76_02985 [Bradymonadaceae bacterium]
MIDLPARRSICALAAAAALGAWSTGCASLRPDENVVEQLKEAKPPGQKRERTDARTRPRSEPAEEDVRRAVYWATRDIRKSLHLAHAAGVERVVEKRRAARKREASDDASGGNEKETSGGDGFRTIARTPQETSSRSSETIQWPRMHSSGSGERVSVQLHAPTTEYDPTNPEDRREIERTYGVEVEPSDDIEVYAGTFTDPGASNELAVVDPGQQIRVYRHGEEVVSTDLPGGKQLPTALHVSTPVRLVRDGTTQLLCYWSERAEEGRIRLKVGVFKVIGHRFGRIFERTVGIRANPGARVERRGYFDFLRGDDHRYIRWTPANSEGRPKNDESTVLEWNHWEGVFRPPSPPPTAPRPSS